MKIIGHRGARGLAPENTLASLHKALEHAVDMVEFDLRVTKDKVVILHHNVELTDPSGEQLVIRDHTYKELKARKPDLTTLEEALAAVPTSTPLYVEIKPEEPTKGIITEIQTALEFGWEADKIQLASFDFKILQELHQALPELETIVIEKWSGVRATRRARQLGTRQISMNQKWLWRGFIQHMARRGWQLYAYTLNDEAKARRWAGYGLAGIVTDYPDRFKR
jgi:glycerophosphoryl diester phosphodiesterase